MGQKYIIYLLVHMHNTIVTYQQPNSNKPSKESILLQSFTDEST